MVRRRPVERRRVVFVGVEGLSDRAFVRFLGNVCERQGLRLHLDVKAANGGDSVAVVEAAARNASRHLRQSQRLVLLDQDRIERDMRAGRNAQAVATSSHLEIVLQKPNLEGVLLRLYPGHERRQVLPQEAMNELKREWPGYEKPPTAVQLEQRFDLDSVLRAAEHDEHLRRLLEVLGLWGRR